MAIPQAVTDALNDLATKIDAAEFAKAADVDAADGLDKAQQAKVSTAARLVQSDADEAASLSAAQAQLQAWANPPAA
jgi:hypothetical protein